MKLIVIGCSGKLISMVLRKCFSPMFVLFIVVTATIAHTASENVHGLSELKQGSMVIKSNQGHYQLLPLLDTQVKLKVSGLIARAEVKQFFQNQTDGYIEATYVFPLPEDSAVDHLSMVIGERRIIGKIKEKSKARKIYQQAKKSGKKAALLEQQRANIFTSKVANIAPGEVIEIAIEYQQQVRYAFGEFSIRFPTTITPRYQPVTNQLQEQFIQTEDNDWTVKTEVIPSMPLLSKNSKIENLISIDVELDAGMPISVIESPYHNVIRQKISSTNYHVSLDDYQITNKDFQLRWRAEKSAEPRLAVFTENKTTEDDDEYLLLMIAPPEPENYQSMPRQLTLVIDQSGSMEGASMIQAALALQAALDKLKSDDKFNVIAFNQQSRSLFDQPVAANRFNIHHAKRFVASLRAEGGTEMMPALRSALTEPVIDGFVRQVVFVTDGAVSNEDELLSLIDADLGRARLFTIGIGSAPNSLFMRKAAQFGRGTFTYISKPAEVRIKMQRLFSQLESPVMQNIHIDWPNEVEQFPQLIPDLYLGEPLTLRVKAEQFTGLINISGDLGQTFWQATVPLNVHQQVNKTNKDVTGVAILWARAKISALLDQQIRAPEKEHIRQQVTDIALEHHLVSRYTSLVAVEQKISRTDEHKLSSKQIANHLPAGSSGQAFAYPATATGWKWQVFMGSLMLLISVISLLSLQRLVRS